jgi:hypothetical protein
VNQTLDDGSCAVTWCEVTQPHTRHYRILGQWHGTSVTDQPEHGVTVQLGVQGVDPADPKPAIALILPNLRQVDAELSTSDAYSLAWRIIGAAGQLKPH